MTTNKQLTNVTHSRQIYLLVTVNTIVRIRTITDVHLPYTVGKNLFLASRPMYHCMAAHTPTALVRLWQPQYLLLADQNTWTLYFSFQFTSDLYRTYRINFLTKNFFSTSHPHKVLASNCATSVLRKKVTEQATKAWNDWGLHHYNTKTRRRQAYFDLSRLPCEKHNRADNSTRLYVRSPVHKVQTTSWCLLTSRNRGEANGGNDQVGHGAIPTRSI